MRFFKNGCNGKVTKFLPGMGVSQECGGEGFVYNGDGEGNFLKSLHIVGRGVLTPYFMKAPYIVCPLPLFQILSTSPPTSLSPETPTSTVLSVVLFLWLNGWSHYIWCAILFYLMIRDCWQITFVMLNGFCLLSKTPHYHRSVLNR